MNKAGRIILLVSGLLLGAAYLVLKWADVKQKKANDPMAKARAAKAAKAKAQVIEVEEPEEIEDGDTEENVLGKDQQ